MRKAFFVLSIISIIIAASLSWGCTVHEHTLECVKAVPSTCETDGNIQYWKCTECGKKFTDENAYTELIDESSVFTPANGHETVYIEETEATCTEYGMSGFWKCRICGKIFADEQATDEILDENSLKVGPEGHDLVNVNAVPATCTENGNIEYWKCRNCNAAFYDSKGEKPCSAADVKIPAGHVYDGEWKRDDK